MCQHASAVGGDAGTAGLAWRGQRPDSTLKSEDLPQPLGPITSTERPVGTSKVSSLTSGVPSGAFRATLHCTFLSPRRLQYIFPDRPACRVADLGACTPHALHLRPAVLYLHSLFNQEVLRLGIYVLYRHSCFTLTHFTQR